MSPPHQPPPHPHGYGLTERLILQPRAGASQQRGPQWLPPGPLHDPQVGGAGVWNEHAPGSRG